MTGNRLRRSKILIFFCLPLFCHNLLSHYILLSTIHYLSSLSPSLPTFYDLLSRPSLSIPNKNHPRFHETQTPSPSPNIEPPPSVSLSLSLSLRLLFPPPLTSILFILTSHIFQTKIDTYHISKERNKRK